MNGLRDFRSHTPASRPTSRFLEMRTKVRANSDWLVSWEWSGNRPEGEVAEVAKEGQVSVESHKGNTISKDAEPENPAVLKKVSELEVEEKAVGNGANGEKKDDGKELKDAEDRKDEEKKPEENGEAHVGEKRNHEATEDREEDGEQEANAGAEADGEEPAAKKQKTGRGRPKKGEANGTPKEKRTPAKKREPKKAATATGEPRRSARNKS